MPSDRKCAYCGSQEQLTREHVFPKFFYSREKVRGDELPVTNVIQKGEEKVVQAELTIADVCRACNGGFLSQLDAYGAVLWDKFFDLIPRPGERVRFEYDFDSLARWLLKLAYNAGRARKSKWHEHVLEQLKAVTQYIRGDGPRPTNLYVYLQLIQSAKLTPEQKQSLLEEDGLDLEEVEARFRRVATFLMYTGPGKVKTGVMRCYLVSINAYHFYLAFWKPDLSRQRMQNLESKFLQERGGARRLRPDASRLVLYPSSVNIVDFIKAHPLMLSHATEGAEWLDRKDAKITLTTRTKHGLHGRL
jgi:hypothetical protein